MYRLIYSGLSTKTWLRYRCPNPDFLITLSHVEEDQYDSCHVEDDQGHLIYEPSLGRELIQDHAPADPGPEWWQDDAGRWHQQPC